MNYTENYHLPQWVETDRVQMEDFNAAMTNIDQGITEAKAAAAAGDTALSGELWAAVLRGAEGDLLAGRSALELGELCHLRELAFHPLEEEALSGDRTLVHWSEERHAFLGSATPVEADQIREGMISYKHGYPGSAQLMTANYIFRAPGSGRLDTLSLVTYFHSSSASLSQYVFQLTAEESTDGEQWETIYTKDDIRMTVECGTPATFRSTAAVNIPIVYGRIYRLSLTYVEGTDATGSFGFARYDYDYDDAPNDFTCTFTPTEDTAGTLTVPLENSGGGSHLLAVLRYNGEPQSGGVNARMGQREMTCLVRRNGKRKDGGACREAVFLLQDAVEAGASLTVDMSCGAEEDLCLWDVCSYLL